MFPGVIHLEEIYMHEKDKLSVEIFTNFTEEDLLPHDWRLVVLSEEEEIKIDFNELRELRPIWLSFTIIAGFILFCLVSVCICAHYIDR